MQRVRRHTIIGLLLVLTVALSVGLSGCGRATSQDGSRIAPQDPTMVAVGEELYQATCAECHGTDLRGTEKGPSHLDIVYEPSHHADAAFYLAVQLGSRAHHFQLGDMPPVEGLTEDDVASIVAYVRETQRTEGFDG